MNYEPNTIDWAVGDLVIHDADAKTAEMLMRVVDIGLSVRQIKMCKYRNPKQFAYIDPTGKFQRLGVLRPIKVCLIKFRDG